MSRRDTIIVAVLINAGLLIVLFATALKTNNETLEMTASTASNFPTIESSMLSSSSIVSDEVEQAALEKEAIAKANPILPAPTLPSTSEISTATEVIDFAADLNGLSLPEISTSISTSPTTIQEEKALSLNLVEVKVKKGDVLEKIARQNQTTVGEIMKLNQLSSTRLKIGQTLKIPGKKSTAVSPAKTSSGSPKYYTVKNGDNPWTIAVKNHMKVEDLLKLNNLNEEKARRLKAGDQLRIE